MSSTGRGGGQPDNQGPNGPKGPRAVSPTPLRDWLGRQPRLRRVGLVALFSGLIACSGQAGVFLPYTPVPATHQILFVLLAGALLGSRLGAISALAYLLGAAVTGVGWPLGAGPTPLVGPLAGYLWCLPLAAYLAGWFVDRYRSEEPVWFAIGATAALGAYEALGSLRLLGAQELAGAEAAVKGAALFVGQHIAQGALTVFIAWSASVVIRAREKK